MRKIKVAEKNSCNYGCYTSDNKKEELKREQDVVRNHLQIQKDSDSTVSKKCKSTAFYLVNLERQNNKYHALKSTIDEIGKIEASKEDFSLLKREVMTSRASTEGGESSVYKYSDKEGVKYLIHEVTNESSCIIHRDFDAVRIASGQMINKAVVLTC